MDDVIGDKNDLDGDFSDDEEFYGDLESAEDHWEGQRVISSSGSSK